MSYLKKIEAKSNTAKAKEWIYQNMNDFIVSKMKDAAKDIIEEAKTQIPENLIKGVNWKELEEEIRRTGSTD